MVDVQFGGHFGYLCTSKRSPAGVQNFSTFLDASLEGLSAVLGSQGYPEGDAFGPIFLTFGGPGALAEIALSLTRNLHLAHLGGSRMQPGTLFFPRPFSRRVPGPTFSGF